MKKNEFCGSDRLLTVNEALRLLEAAKQKPLVIQIIECIGSELRKLARELRANTVAVGECTPDESLGPGPLQ